MPNDPTREVSDSGRRTLIRTLMGGTALAALTATALPAAAAAAGPRPPADNAGDPFAVDEFPSSGRVREYWIQADSFQHNTVPNGRDGLTGMRFMADQTTYWAVGFRAYTPGWGRPLDADLGPQGIGANSGIPGPVIRAEVGDVIRLHFRNNDEHYKLPHSMHPHGVRYDRDNDGAWRADDPDRPGTAVPYGSSYTYTWTCRRGSVGTWPYHDHSMPGSIPKPAPKAAPKSAPKARSGAAAMPVGAVMEIGAELGLFGIIAITDENTPPVDQEFVLFLHEAYPTDVPSLRKSDMVNGSAYINNTPTCTAKTGDRVRWRIAALGREFHVFHIHGHIWRSHQGWVDSQILGPSTALTVEYTEDNPGDWLYHCHLSEHMMGGMVGRYLVTT
ncbi:multicopper oxidase domain-containing protein [Streptomyces sp. H10-C2]|uniref:multicopper oxidase domain-containing protein n=1 Tax=unclassified Streptomyces TaxID=2593676 RepID=UPI0024B951D3|nr:MULTISPECIES: multicopper oxidase domain-containing protein [unclassified Streptomyces]MDJ0345165.1 multicopper oxidase domain-containing protein [Streptomyces sp. PH10-H1]MDJ0374133.1 multicopper oxidase domain-containing protein [Streptomyces sp. H10-C2]